MNNQNRILLYSIQYVVQTVEVDVVDTGFVLTELIQFPLGHVRVRHAVAGAFTPAVVVAPQQVETGMVKYIEQTFTVMGEVRVIFFRVMPENMQGTETAVSVPQEEARGS